MVYLLYQPPQASVASERCSPEILRPTQRAPDWWESARFQAVCVA